MKKKIFISFFNEDYSKVDIISKEIKKSDFFDIIVYTDSKYERVIHLSDKVTEGIEISDYFLPIITKRSIKTQWINQEIGFAKALNKKIIPIVDNNIINELKGFINNQIDLPYKYESNDSILLENNSFKNAVYILLNVLHFENNSLNKKIGDLFPGKWESNFNILGIKSKDENITIIENDYLINGKKIFSIENINIDIINNKIAFTKKEVEKPYRILKNELKINEIGVKYEGMEIGKFSESRINYIKMRK